MELDKRLWLDLQLWWPLSCRYSQEAWRLSHHYVPRGTCNQERIMIICPHLHRL
jgi:hypothetical protein